LLFEHSAGLLSALAAALLVFGQESQRARVYGEPTLLMCLGVLDGLDSLVHGIRPLDEQGLLSGNAG
jgi:hypothetical protein